MVDKRVQQCSRVNRLGAHGLRGMHVSGWCMGQRVCMGEGVCLGQRVCMCGSMGVHGFTTSVLYFSKLAHKPDYPPVLLVFPLAS